MSGGPNPYLSQATALGIIDWNLRTSDDFYRDYTLRTLVATPYSMDGPLSIINAQGVAAMGSAWQFGNDYDDWVICHPQCTVTPVVTKEPNFYWIVEQLFSNRPLKRCISSIMTNPLLEPPKISGTFTRYKTEANYDYFGNPILSSSYEFIDGIYRDQNRPSVVIEQNYSTSLLSVFSPMICSTNLYPMWGLNSDCVMLTNVAWTRLLMPSGFCSWYYTLRLEFEVHYEGFKLNKDNGLGIQDVGHRILLGNYTGTPPVWSPVAGLDPTKISSYQVVKDPNGENHPKPIPLDGSGGPLLDLSNPIYLPTINVQGQSDFSALGLPATL